MARERKEWVALYVDPFHGVPTILPARGRSAARVIRGRFVSSHKFSAFLTRSATVMPGEWLIYVLTRHGFEYQYSIKKERDSG